MELLKSFLLIQTLGFGLVRMENSCSVHFEHYLNHSNLLKPEDTQFWALKSRVLSLLVIFF